MSLPRRLTGLLLGLAHVLQVTGCSTWVSQREAPAVVAVQYPGRDMRVTLADGRRLELRGVRVEGDSLHGTPVPKAEPGPRPYETTAPAARDTAPPPEVTLAVADVTGMQVRKPNGGRTAGAVVAVVVVVGLVVGAAVAASNFNPMGGCCGLRLAP